MEELDLSQDEKHLAASVMKKNAWQKKSDTILKKMNTVIDDHPLVARQVAANKGKIGSKVVANVMSTFLEFSCQLLVAWRFLMI